MTEITVWICRVSGVSSTLWWFLPCASISQWHENCATQPQDSFIWSQYLSTVSKFLISTKYWWLCKAQSQTSSLKICIGIPKWQPSNRLPFLFSFLDVICSVQSPDLKHTSKKLWEIVYGIHLHCNFQVSMPSCRSLIMYHLMYTTSIPSLSKIYYLLSDEAMAQVKW